MAVLIAEEISRRGYNGSRLSSRVICVVVLSLVLELATGQNHVPPTDDNKTEEENQAEKPGSGLNLDLYAASQTKELELTMMQDKKNLTLNMDRDSSMEVNVTLHCSHPSVAYSIRISSDNALVAAVADFQMFNISCAAVVFPSGGSGRNASDDATSSGAPHSKEGKENSTLLSSVPVVEGVFNFTLRGGILGRAWLHISAERCSDPGVVLPSFLTLPWNNTKAASVSENPQQDHGMPSPRNDTSGSAVPGYEAAADGGGGGSEVAYGIAVHDDDSVVKTELEMEKHLVTVLRIRRPIDIAFRAVLYGFVILATVGMGCKTEISVVKEVLRKPVAPGIGFVCQYLFMPLIAYFLAKTVVHGDPALSLGIFTCGICPGGGPSNLFSYLLDGDVSLSVTMTAVSSVAALAMIPVWLFTLGAQFEDDKISLKVPFVRIFMTLGIIIIPLFIGLAIKRWAPKVAKWILKVLKPFTLLAILFLLTMGVYANLYVFRLFSPRTILAGCLLPYVGYALGAVISLVLRQPCYRVKTIAIETGIQNTSIAYLLLIFSLPDPDGDMAAVGPMASAIMTPLPLFLLVLVYLTYKRCTKEKRKRKEEEGGVDERNGNVEKCKSGEMV